MTTRVLVASLLVLATRPASGQVLERSSPFRGVLIPGGGLAGEADATALELNPGQLGLIDGSTFALVADHWPDGTARAGRGGGLLLAIPLFGSSLATGVQWLRPTLPGEPGSYGKLQLAYGLRLGRGGGLGVAWERLFGDTYGGSHSFTIGLGARLHRMLALGAAVRDIAEPRPRAGARLPREWDGELVIRPLGTDVLQVGFGARWLQGAGIDDLFLPHGRLSARLARGLALFAQVDTVRNEWGGMAGLHVDFERNGVTLAGVGSGAEGEGLGPGASVMLRGFPARAPTLFPGRHIQRVKLRDLESDTAFLDTVVQLRQLGDDPAVAAVLLEIDGLALGLARVQELRALIAELRRRKPVLAFVDAPSTREYYLASACDRIVMHPAGALGLTGLAQTVTFYKGLLDRLGVEVELVRIAELKGAMEPFVFNESSAPVRENREAVLDDHFQRLVADVARGRGRGLAPDGVRALVDQGLFTPEEARRQKLVDAVVDDQALERHVGEAIGRKLPLREGDGRRAFPAWVPARVAVVLVDGPIVDGPERGLPLSSAPVAFGDRIVEALERVRRDGSIRALVLRVNSPGGSALASDRIARAVARVREARKPVIVSMGDFAASGGYYVSAPGQSIYASPGTITGSIGIFGYKIDAARLMEKVGVAAETSRRGEHADLFSIFRPWTDEERRRMEDVIRHMYRLFLETIEKGRKDRGITAARADELGRGRIWTGAQALAVKLVDGMGGLSDAIDDAARRAGVPRGPGGLPELVVLPRRPPSAIEALLRLRGLEQQALADLPLLRAQGRSAARLLTPLLLGPGSGAEARLPYDLEIR